MTHEERLDYLLSELFKEAFPDEKTRIPENTDKKKALLRGLMNIRMPLKPLNDKFLSIQDEYLKEEINKRGITDIQDLKEIQKDIYLWRGDITALKVDAIVNAANSKMLGCFIPGHNCIDNAIHTFSGMQLRLYCHVLMQKQGNDEPTGKAKITPAYNLPCKYIIHTVGPVISGTPTEKQCSQLASSYDSCLQTALENNVESIALCCISTGEFSFPNKKAAEIAVKTVKNFKKIHNSDIKVIFNVFKELDFHIYENLLKAEYTF